MSSKLIRNEIPIFMHRLICSATFYVSDSEHFNVLILSLNKKLYLVRRREILSEISLQNTVFKNEDFDSVATSCESLHSDDHEDDSCTAIEVQDLNSHVLEKFILNDDLHGRMTFVLIKVNDKLVVLEIQKDSSFLVVKELEDIDDFIVLENPKYSYKPSVQILFRNGQCLETNFSKIDECASGAESSNSVEHFKSILKSLELGCQKMRIELQELQEETKRRLVGLFILFTIHLLRSFAYSGRSRDPRLPLERADR